jgi:predicted PurR-regulated permease PerM
LNRQQHARSAQRRGEGIITLLVFGMLFGLLQVIVFPSLADKALQLAKSKKGSESRLRGQHRPLVPLDRLLRSRDRERH